MCMKFSGKVDFCRVFETNLPWTMTKFWWRSRSQIWIWIATLVGRALVEVCIVPVLLVIIIIMIIVIIIIPAVTKSSIKTQQKSTPSLMTEFLRGNRGRRRGLWLLLRSPGSWSDMLQTAPRRNSTEQCDYKPVNIGSKMSPLNTVHLTLFLI